MSYKIGSLDGTLSVRDLVDRLHRPGHLPISFVESARPANVRFAGEALTARDALLRATDTGAYLCQVIRGHVVVYPSEPLYQREICGVRIRDAYRARAMRKYLERLAEETEELKHVGWLSNGDPASLTYSTQVSLSRCAPLITHFAEILGKDHEVFFSIRQWKPGMLIATFGEVWANPRPE